MPHLLTQILGLNPLSQALKRDNVTGDSAHVYTSTQSGQWIRTTRDSSNHKMSLPNVAYSLLRRAVRALVRHADTSTGYHVLGPGRRGDDLSDLVLDQVALYVCVSKLDQIFRTCATYLLT